MWRSAYDTADIDHENHFKPYEYDLKKGGLHQNTIENEKWFILNSNGYRAYSLNDMHNPHMLTLIIFENKNKITTIIKKRDNNI